MPNGGGGDGMAGIDWVVTVEEPKRCGSADCCNVDVGAM